MTGGFQCSMCTLPVAPSSSEIGEQQHEVRTQFRPVPSDLTLTEAASRVAGDSKLSLTESHCGSH